MKPLFLTLAAFYLVALCVCWGRMDVAERAVALALSGGFAVWGWKC